MLPSHRSLQSTKHHAIQAEDMHRCASPDVVWHNHFTGNKSINLKKTITYDGETNLVCWGSSETVV